jgi:hypothetical protein
MRLGLLRIEGERRKMDAKHEAQQSSRITTKQLLTFARALVGGTKGREDDEHPLPLGRWDSVIRVAFERLGRPRPEPWTPRPEPWQLNPVPWTPHPEPWRPIPEPWKALATSILAAHPEIWDAIGGGPRFGEEVALNPQPLPPRYALLVSIALAVASRAQLFQEIADATSRESEQRGIVGAGGYIAKFADELCGPAFRLRYPFPGPHPPWFGSELDGIDLLVVAAQFEASARETFNPALSQDLANASAKFLEVGLARVQ